MSGLVIINPGTGPVANFRVREADRITLKNAIANVRAWCRDARRDRDAGAPFTWMRMPVWDDDGRYGFQLRHMRRSRRRGAKPTDLVECFHQIDMPGLPLERVRYVGRQSQNIWDFPRLYLDGSSWVWKFSFPNCNEETQS